MQFQFGTALNPQAQAPAAHPVLDLLQQMLEVQKEQLALTRQMNASQENHNGRWRKMVNGWCEQFPGLPESAKASLPVLEKAFGSILANMVDEIQYKGEEALENEFAIQDFLDRFGMRVGQMSHILNFISPLAELPGQNQQSSPNESSGNG